MGGMPGIAVYIVKPGESLWDIGKRYYIPISQLKESNDLSGDDVRAGDKILIVKNQT
jgi:LysM repeat protein